MKYDFETVRKRFKTGSMKWGKMVEYGVKESEDIIPFSVADMEFVTPPEIVEALKCELDTSIMGYENPTPEYLDTVCSWMKSRRNWDAEPEWILPSSGVVNAFFEAVKTYTDEGNGVMIMTPVYFPMSMAINSTHRKLVNNPLINTGTSYEIDFDDMERKASDPNTKIELERIGEICLRNDVLVVSDEIHFDLIMPGHVHTVFASISDKFAQNCLVLTAPSKTFNIAGLQTSNIFIPNPKLREKFLASLKLSNPNPKCNILGYVACEAAYKHCGEWLDECLSVIDANRRAVHDFMAAELPSIKVYDLEGTYLQWLDMNDLGLDYREIERTNHEEARLFFDEGYVFGKQGEGFERWNLACPTRYIHEALARMKGAYSKYLR